MKPIKLFAAKSRDFNRDEEEYMTKGASKRFIEGDHTHVKEGGRIYTAHYVQHDTWTEVYVGEDVNHVT